MCSCHVANAISNPMAVYDLAANSMCLKIDYSITIYYNVNWSFVQAHLWFPAQDEQFNQFCHVLSNSWASQVATAESLQSCRRHQGSHPQLLGFGYLEADIRGTYLGHTWPRLGHVWICYDMLVRVKHQLWQHSEMVSRLFCGGHLSMDSASLLSVMVFECPDLGIQAFCSSSYCGVSTFLCGWSVVALLVTQHLAQCPQCQRCWALLFFFICLWKEM